MSTGLLIVLGIGYLAGISIADNDPHGGDVTGFSESWIVLSSEIPIEVVQAYERASYWIEQKGFEQIASPAPDRSGIGQAEQVITVKWFEGRVNGSDPLHIQLILALEFDASKSTGHLSLRARCLWEDHDAASSEQILNFVGEMRRWWLGQEETINNLMQQRRDEMWPEWNEYMNDR